MPKVAIKAGAELDILSAKELHDELEEIKTQLHKLSSRRQPIPRTVSNQVTLSAAGAGTINLGAPSLGDAWDVRRINVTPQDPTGASIAVTSVVVWRGTDTTNPNNYVDIVRAIPAVSPWSSRQFTVRQDEVIFITVLGGPPSTVIFASAQVMEAAFEDIYGRELS